MQKKMLKVESQANSFEMEAASFKPNYHIPCSLHFISKRLYTQIVEAPSKYAVYTVHNI